MSRSPTARCSCRPPPARCTSTRRRTCSHRLSWTSRLRARRCSFRAPSTSWRAGPSTPSRAAAWLPCSAFRASTPTCWTVTPWRSTTCSWPCWRTRGTRFGSSTLPRANRWPLSSTSSRSCSLPLARTTCSPLWTPTGTSSCRPRARGHSNSRARWLKVSRSTSPGPWSPRWTAATSCRCSSTLASCGWTPTSSASPAWSKTRRTWHRSSPKSSPLPTIWSRFESTAGQTSPRAFRAIPLCFTT
mmetsp:Transcript_1904/g.5789  ORF Transcript_1904/g.5789 Transcript_1904/m.5789 type:complete len:244 (-) Transcript_1904:485-1216(-)